MSRMGALGAIGGAAGGLSKFLSEEMAQKRAMTLEQQRTENRLEANRMNNEMRHELSLKELKARDEMARARQSDQNAWELENRDNSTEYGQRISELQGLLPDATPEELVNIAYGRGSSDGPGSMVSGSIQKITEQVPMVGPDGKVMVELDDMGNEKVKFTDQVVGYSWLTPNGQTQTSYIDGRGATQPNPNPNPNQDPSSPPGPNGNAAPQEAIDDLMKNNTPEMRKQFRDFYGFLPEGVGGPAPSTSQPAPSVAPDSVGAGAPPDHGRQGKKYGASLGEIFGTPAKATAEAASNAVAPIVDPIRQSMDKTAALGEYQRYKQLGYWEKDMPAEVLEAVLPYLKGEEAKKVANVIADSKYSVASRN